MNGRAFYRNYVAEGRRAKQVRRLHIVREDGRNPGRGGYCGVQLGNVTHSRGVVIEPFPATPPAGMRWCGHCLGEHAERVGVTNKVAIEIWAAERMKRAI